MASTSAEPRIEWSALPVRNTVGPHSARAQSLVTVSTRANRLVAGSSAGHTPHPSGELLPLQGSEEVVTALGQVAALLKAAGQVDKVRGGGDGWQRCPLLPCVCAAGPLSSFSCLAPPRAVPPAAGGHRPHAGIAGGGAPSPRSAGPLGRAGRLPGHRGDHRLRCISGGQEGGAGAAGVRDSASCLGSTTA